MKKRTPEPGGRGAAAPAAPAAAGEGLQAVQPPPAGAPADALASLEPQETLAQVLVEVHLSRPLGLGPLELQRAVQTLLSAARGPESLRAAALVLCRHAEALKDEKVYQVAAVVLRDLRPREMAGWVLIDVISSALGPATLARVLGLLGDLDLQAFAQLVAAVYSRAGGTLRDVLEDRWIALARSSRGVRLWAEAHPESFTKAALHDRLLKVCRREKVLEGIDLLAKESPAAAAALLRSFPADSPLHVDVVYRILERSSGDLRLVALRELGRIPTSRAIAVLGEVLKRNNARELPDEAEVEAALLALLDIRSPEACAILDEIAGRTKVFHSYRRQIRRKLVDLQRGSLVL